MLRNIVQMAEATTKKIKTLPVTIGTHNGCFHADEALAVYMLRLLPFYNNSQLIRTRDSTLLSTCHTVVDVGGEYCPEKNRFDHHQRGFNITFPNRSTKLSSAGLVFLHFGKAIIAQHIGVSESAEDVQIIWEKIYTSFVEALDAHDNGISVYDAKEIAAAGLEKKFSDSGFTLGAMVARLNPNWNDPIPSDPERAQQIEDEKFLTASSRMGEEFYRTLDYFSKSWIPARQVVHKAFSKRLEYDTKGRILVLEGQSVPWKDHLYDLEMQEGIESRILYVLYPERPTVDSKWKIQCVPESKDSFQSRKPLPEAWRGYRDEKLDEVSGIPNGVFVHAAGFIGGNKTYKGVMDMAIKALDL
ncbi:MYG1 exonuclease [Erysiphe necator]|uniref:Putative myg1 protein n=1 Tax=Uncinula necator TaxID=52586 RepID=A0A0B1P0E0_UNCNE|nr:MYG1 exonuclease [Erysiphe necator]KHJ30351.1 putative myg1 protein [Erysiphe necator]